MCKLRNATLLSALGVAVLVVLSCDRTPTPVSPQAHRPDFSDAAPCGGSNPTPCPAPSGRITGGGRIDDNNGTRKNNFFEPGVCTGKSWATFGFNARPGKGEIQWVDHCRGLRIHGFTVDFFDPFPDPGNPNPNHLGETGICFRWGGQAKVNGADGFHYVTIACDRGEPGVSHDQIAMSLTDNSYGRFGVLTGGNIQVHPTH